MDQVLLDQILSWPFLPFVVLADIWTTVVSGICSGLSWLRDAMHYLWTIAVFGIGVVLMLAGRSALSLAESDPRYLNRTVGHQEDHRAVVVHAGERRTV